MLNREATDRRHSRFQSIHIVINTSVLIPSFDQWSDESLSRVDLIDHWSENGFARKERHRPEILIRILPKERTLRFDRFSLNFAKTF